MPKKMSEKMEVLLGKITDVLNERKTRVACITYSMLAEDLGGYAPDSKYIAICLGILQKEDTKNGSPLRSALVVRKDTRRPGYGFYECAEILGHKFTDTEEFWGNQIKEMVVNTTPPPLRTIRTRA